MSIVYKSHGGRIEMPGAKAPLLSAPAVAGHVAVDAEADFGFLIPPELTGPGTFLLEGQQSVQDLDDLGAAMVAPDTSDDNSELAPILTYWGQFLDHELTLRSNGEDAITKIEHGEPPLPATMIEKGLKNARTPRFDLDSVYGGLPLGTNIAADDVTVISAMRHPEFKNKMRIGTTRPPAVRPGEQQPKPVPDGLDVHRDLPRYVQASQAVRDAAIRVFNASERDPAKRASFAKGLPKRALIGDARNDENLVVAQFHLSVLRFHNRVVDALVANPKGWIADFHAAQTLTRLHYQWLIVEGYLKAICSQAVVDAVVADRALQFFAFRAQYSGRNPDARDGNALPIEFVGAAFRFAHSMVRNDYDHNKNFENASLDLLFRFTGGGTLINDDTDNRLTHDWIIDWSRFTSASDAASGAGAVRRARKIDTRLAPRLGTMVKEGDNSNPPSDLSALLKNLARRNLRRGYNLRLPTGQALHAYLHGKGAVASAPIADLTTLGNLNEDVKVALSATKTGMATRTPLWLYILAEAEQGGGNKLGELGNWLVASTFIGVLLADPDSALSQGFHPDHSPLRMPDGSAIDTIEKWLKFALVLE